MTDNKPEQQLRGVIGAGLRKQKQTFIINEHEKPNPLLRLEAYTSSGPAKNRYEFNLQVWGAGNNNIFITKGDVEMWSGGGYNTATEAIEAALEYLDRVNKKP
jgi:hypothetical protein